MVAHVVQRPNIDAAVWRRLQAVDDAEDVLLRSQKERLRPAPHEHDVRVWVPFIVAFPDAYLDDARVIHRR